jgi:hypothetical protein
VRFILIGTYPLPTGGGECEYCFVKGTIGKNKEMGAKMPTENRKEGKRNRRQNGKRIKCM